MDKDKLALTIAYFGAACIIITLVVAYIVFGRQEETDTAANPTQSTQLPTNVKTDAETIDEAGNSSNPIPTFRELKKVIEDIAQAIKACDTEKVAELELSFENKYPGHSQAMVQAVGLDLKVSPEEYNKLPELIDDLPPYPEFKSFYESIAAQTQQDTNECLSSSSNWERKTLEVVLKAN